MSGAPGDAEPDPDVLLEDLRRAAGDPPLPPLRRQPLRRLQRQWLHRLYHMAHASLLLPWPVGSRRIRGLIWDH